jgi:hypothetical protein
VGTGQSTITFPAYFEDSRGNAKRIAITGVRASVQGGTPYVVTATFGAANVISIETRTIAGVLTDVQMSLKISGTVGAEPKVEDYGGDPDKTDTEEESTPYAWAWYLELEGMLGSAFTKSRTGVVHAEKLAKARLFGAGIQRSFERFRNNCVPATATDMLTAWARCFNVQTGPSIPEWKVRRSCATKMKLLTGCTKPNIDAALAELFGDILVSVNRNDTNDLDDPPENTYWPNGDPGDPSYSICGYQWSSGRCHVWVQVSWPPDMSKTEFLHLMEVEYFRLMDIALPAHATFAWDLDTSTGFLLDISLMDYDTF